METLVIVVHIVVAVAIVGLILLQQGKGAEMGASFGSGSSQTLFGPQGSGTVFSRATAILAAIFFVTSFTLAVIAKDKESGGVEEGVPAAEVPAMDQADDRLDIEIPETPPQDKPSSEIPD